MKKRHLCVILLLCLGLTACGANTAAEGSEPGTEVQTRQESIAEPIEAVSETEAEQETAAASEAAELQQETAVEAETGMQQETAPAEAEKSYFGDWQITECAGFASVSALSQEEADAYTGTTLTYQADAMSVGTEENIEVSGYEETPYQTAAMTEDYRVNPENLGIETEEMLSVFVGANGDYFGQYFFVLDENALLIYHEGAFFRAERVG